MSLTPIEYGRETGGVIRKHRGLIAAGALLVVVVLLVYVFRENNQVKQLRSLCVQRQLMTFSASKDQVMYEEDPALCLQLLNGGHYQRGTFSISGLAQPLSLPVMFDSGISEDDSHGASGLQTNNPFVFRHERYSPGGHRRLVEVSTHAGWTGEAWNGDRLATDLILRSGERMVPLCYGVYTPLDWHVGSKASMASFIPPSIEIRVNDFWRMYAGQIDPADATHFTIGYAINGKRGTIEGWLKDNDGLRFKLVDGPATTRPVEYFSP